MINSQYTYQYSFFDGHFRVCRDGILVAKLPVCEEATRLIVGILNAFAQDGFAANVPEAETIDALVIANRIQAGKADN